MVRVNFEYADALSNWEWRKQECVVRDLDECIKLYGLGIDCDYRIISVEEIRSSTDGYEDRYYIGD